MGLFIQKLTENVHQKECVIMFVFLMSLGTTMIYAGRFDTYTPRNRCEKPDMIPNGSIKLRRNNMRIICNPGYQLQGYKFIGCVHGKWSEEKPICAKKGCQQKLKNPPNGQIIVENELKAILFCSDNYNLAGNRYSYCNGTHWDRPIGDCRERKNVIQHECDFETDDVCGWVYEPKEGLEWKRVMAANVFMTFRTGPRHDHTTMKADGGHYMLMESLGRHSTFATLISPIYDQELSLRTACCFRFFYFMYGSGVGDLYVAVKPVSVTLSELFSNKTSYIQFQRSGNQNNLWNEAFFNIEELEEDFQIVFIASGGRGHLSDIAIDDVKLMTGDECRTVEKAKLSANKLHSNENVEMTTYESVFDVQSCVDRCNQISSNGVIRNSGHLIALCSCDVDCEENETCCLDYRSVCLNDGQEDSTVSYGLETTSPHNLFNEKMSSWSSTSTRTTMKTTTSITSKTTKLILPFTRSIPEALASTISKIATLKPTTVTAITKRPGMTTITTELSTSPLLIVTESTSSPISQIPTQANSAQITKANSVETTSTIMQEESHASTIPLFVSSIVPTNSLGNYMKSNTKQFKSRTSTFLIKEIDLESPDVLHIGFNMFLVAFVLILIVIMLATGYHRFIDRAEAWYAIQFRKNNSGEENTSSMTINCKQIQRRLGFPKPNRKFHPFHSSAVRSNIDTKSLLWEDDDYHSDDGVANNIV